MTDEKIKKCIAVVLLVVAGLLCFFVIGKYASEPETFDKTSSVNGVILNELTDMPAGRFDT